MKSKFNPPVRDGKPIKCIACGNPLHHKSEQYCSKKCATKMESEGIGNVPAFLSKWKLRKYKEFKDPLLVLRNRTRRKTKDLLKKGIIQKQTCVVCGKHDVIAHHEDYSRPNDVIWICEKHHAKYHNGKIGLFKNKLWWNPKRLLPRIMRDGNMPGKYQKLKSQFKKK
jgi:predicted nucleic acid-binding Zn ribbon protein